MNRLIYKTVGKHIKHTCNIHRNIKMSVSIGNAIFCPVCLGLFTYKIVPRIRIK